MRERGCRVQADGLDERSDMRDLLQVKSICKVQARRCEREGGAGYKKFSRIFSSGEEF